MEPVDTQSLSLCAARRIRSSRIWGIMNFDRAYFRDTHHKRRQLILDYLGGDCAQCGSTEDLETDHIDPSTKCFSINKRMSLKNNKDEIDKCQLLCNTCHTAKTSAERTGFTHGSAYGWQKARCACIECESRKRSDYDKKNAKRRLIHTR